MNIGMIGLDTSHVKAFAEIVHDEAHPYHIPGHRVVAGFPGGSEDLAVSKDRVAGFTEWLTGEQGAKLAQSPEEVAELSDIVFITAVDGRSHLQYFEKIASARKPVFIDKPFTCSSADAKKILELAEKNNIPLITASSLRYSESFMHALTEQADSPVSSVQVYGPIRGIDQIPYYFWYGVHSVEMLIKAMGAGCKQVTAYSGKDQDLIVGEWADGRIGTVRGTSGACGTFGGVIFREKAAIPYQVSGSDKPYYVSLLEEILTLPETRQGPQTAGEILEVVRFMEAATESRQQGGKPVAL